MVSSLDCQEVLPRSAQRVPPDQSIQLPVVPGRAISIDPRIVSVEPLMVADRPAPSTSTPAPVVQFRLPTMYCPLSLIVPPLADAAAQQLLNADNLHYVK